MARIHFIVKETAKIRYQDQARREGKSLGEWIREAADEKLASARPRRFTVEELREFAAKCDAMHPPGTREPDWPEIKRMIAESRYPDLERLKSLPRRFDPREQ
ncbi:MAG: hypothetical protein OXQ94_17245 [Gemmatimonadota bacterium]|nr:hypothetical protein [Gemmatimonadota bacterium]MDE2873425.1 hypothetical protein [Gemmatimonadota bacterium]